MCEIFINGCCKLEPTCATKGRRLLGTPRGSSPISPDSWAPAGLKYLARREMGRIQRNEMNSVQPCKNRPNDTSWYHKLAGRNIACKFPCFISLLKILFSYQNKMFITANFKIRCLGFIGCKLWCVYLKSENLHFGSAADMSIISFSTAYFVVPYLWVNKQAFFGRKSTFSNFNSQYAQKMSGFRPLLMFLVESNLSKLFFIYAFGILNVQMK